MGDLDEKTKEIYTDIALMKAVDETIDSEKRTSKYIKEVAKVKKRFEKAVEDAKKRASDFVEEMAVFEGIKKEK